jgi:hypothetical protein
MARTLVRFSYQQLQSELRRRQRSVGSLESRRNKLMKKLAHVDSLIREMGGTVNGRAGRTSGGRPRNDMTLTGALEKVLANKTMSVVDAADAVQKIGYRTNSNSFRTQVNIALIKSGKFKRVGRGQYTVK